MQVDPEPGPLPKLCRHAAVEKAALNLISSHPEKGTPTMTGIGWMPPYVPDHAHGRGKLCPNWAAGGCTIGRARRSRRCGDRICAGSSSHDSLTASA